MLATRTRLLDPDKIDVCARGRAMPDESMGEGRGEYMQKFYKERFS